LVLAWVTHYGSFDLLKAAFMSATSMSVVSSSKVQEMIAAHYSAFEGNVFEAVV